MTQEDQQTGTVERLTDRGFGFIRIDGERQSVFFHAKDVQRGLRFDEIEQGDRVSFSMTTTNKGLAAIGVDIIGRPRGASAEDDDNESYDWGGGVLKSNGPVGAYSCALTCPVVCPPVARTYVRTLPPSTAVTPGLHGWRQSPLTAVTHVLENTCVTV